MSPTAALHSSIFWRYAAITAALLVVAGAALVVMRFAFGRDVRSVWLTYRSWLVMVPTIAIVVFLGQWAVVGGCTLLAVLGFLEFARAADLQRDRTMTLATCVLLLASGAACLLRRSSTSMGAFAAMPTVATLCLLALPVVRNRVGGQLRCAAMCLLGFALGWMFLHLSLLAGSANPYGYVLFAIFATEVNDIAAFAFGKILGHRPLRSNISPRKTWGGALGAAGVSIVLPSALAFSFQGRLSAVGLLVAGFIVGVGGQLGDLCISAVKRDLGVKDLGTAIPGHGGILDRIDSLIVVAPLLAHLFTL